MPYTITDFVQSQNVLKNNGFKIGYVTGSKFTYTISARGFGEIARVCNKELDRTGSGIMIDSIYGRILNVLKTNSLIEPVREQMQEPDVKATYSTPGVLAPEKRIFRDLDIPMDGERAALDEMMPDPFEHHPGLRIDQIRHILDGLTEEGTIRQEGDYLFLNQKVGYRSLDSSHRPVGLFQDGMLIPLNISDSPFANLFRRELFAPEERDQDNHF